MNIKFNDLPWHDSILLSINIDRLRPGKKDVVTIEVQWSDGSINKVIFNDCYLFDAQMNFGIMADECILEAECITETKVITNLKAKWESLKVDLSEIKCYQIITNSTNSKIDIYALSYELL